MKSVVGKGTVFPLKLKLQGESFEKENFIKDLMNLIEANHQINMTSDHAVSSNNSFKNHLNAKSFNMFFKTDSDSDSVSVAKMMWTYKGDVNSASGENRKEPSPSTKLPEASFNSNSNKDNLDVDETCWH